MDPCYYTYIELFVWLKLLQNVAADMNDIVLLPGGTVSQMLGCSLVTPLIVIVLL